MISLILEKQESTVLRLRAGELRWSGAFDILLAGLQHHFGITIWKKT